MTEKRGYPVSLAIAWGVLVLASVVGMLGAFFDERGQVYFGEPVHMPLKLLAVIMILVCWLGHPGFSIASDEKLSGAEKTRLIDASGSLPILCIAFVSIFLLSKDLTWSASQIAPSFDQKVGVKFVSVHEQEVKGRIGTSRVYWVNVDVGEPLESAVRLRVNFSVAHELQQRQSSDLSLCVTVSRGVFGGYWVKPSSLEIACNNSVSPAR